MRRLNSYRSTLALAAVAAVITASYAGSALATDFEFGDGWKGIWSTTVSLGTNIRAQGRNPLLY
ncbi:MAG: hypothetical protein NTY41_06150, partial [Proteobacteria bacterium]|nr:hypothetical protein [Pseudomonadota bacterium]